MPIDLTPPQIDAALPQVGKGLQQYLWLQSKVAEQRDFYEDLEFRRHFNGFYRVRRGPMWQDAFYELMGRAKREQLQFSAVLLGLHGATTRYEASFASKLVATVDTAKPVIDAFVLKNVGLRLPRTAAIDRAERICHVYGELISIFATFLSGESGRYLVAAFNRAYPSATITREKMLDLVLWQTRHRRPQTDKRSVRGQETRIGQHTRPSRCPSCGASRFAEILYGMPAASEELDQALDRGAIVLGGCCVSDEMPRWRCGNCEHEWGTLSFRDTTRTKA